MSGHRTNELVILLVVLAASIRAEQITSTCRITAVDSAAHTVTLVRKSTTGEKMGVAKVAAVAKITVSGKAGELNNLAVPLDATVVYDTEQRAVVEITIAAGTTPAGSGPPRAIAPFDAAKAKEYQEVWAKHFGVPVEFTNSIGMKFVLIPPGEFEMGSTQEEIERFKLDFQGQPIWTWINEHLMLMPEGHIHHVTISRAFYLARCEVTQREFIDVMRANPSHFSPTGNGKANLSIQNTDSLPAEMISPSLAKEFCEALGRLSGEKNGHRLYRLPTEAEWEYACRAGSTTSYYFGNDAANLAEYAWFGGAGGTTHPVGQKKPNAWGLHDMNGNVSEWSSDWFRPGGYTPEAVVDPTGPETGSLRMIRGGAWDDPPPLNRPAFRFAFDPDFRNYGSGIRVLCEIAPRLK